MQHELVSEKSDSGKHKEAFSTLVESLVQMTLSDFTISFKLAEFAAFCYGKQWKVYLFTKNSSNQGVD